MCDPVKREGGGPTIRTVSSEEAWLRTLMASGTGRPINRLDLSCFSVGLLLALAAVDFKTGRGEQPLTTW